MMPVDINAGLLLLDVYVALNPRGGPSWAVFGWPALFGSLSFQMPESELD